MIALLAGATLSAIANPARAADINWRADAPGRAYNSANNWVGGSVPGQDDDAIFDASNVFNLSIGSDARVGGWNFSSGAGDYVFTIPSAPNVTFIFVGGGISVEGGSVSITNGGHLNFNSSSTAATATITNSQNVNFRNSSAAADAIIVNDGFVDFYDTATAANSTITNNGTTTFQHDSTAADAIITNNQVLNFYDSGTAGSATITNNDEINFGHESTAGNATIDNGGRINFNSNGIRSSTAGNAAIDNRLATSVVNFADTNRTDLSIGSFSGIGQVQLGSRALATGGNDLSTTFSGVISGAGGSLTKVGVGTFTLSGANTYSGPTTVNGGNLVVNGSLASVATVNSDARLSGNGSIGGLVLDSGGTLAPGNSIGTMTVTGDASFNAGSIYEVEVEAPDQADKTVVTGTATIDGGAIEIVKLSTAETSYLSGQTYRIIEAGSVSRVSDFTFNSPFIFLRPGLVYGADFVDLELTRTASFGDVAQSLNQTQAGAALDGLAQNGDALAVFNELLTSADDDTARQAMDLASGEIHASGQHVAWQTNDLFARMLRGNAQAGLGALGSKRAAAVPIGYGPTSKKPGGAVAIDALTTSATGSAYSSERVSNAWITALGGGGSIDPDGNAAETNWYSGGIAGGNEGALDVANGSAWAGFGLGYLKSRGNVDARLSSIDGDGAQLGIYGGWARGQWTLTGALAYSASHVETTRNVIIGDINRTALANYWNHSLGFAGEAAHAFDLDGGFTVSPLASIDASWTGHGGFVETGAGALNLTAASTDWMRFDTGLGLEMSRTLDIANGGSLILKARAVWEHAFADALPGQSLALAGSSTGFEVKGPDAGRDRLRLGAVLSFDVGQNMAMRASYDGLFSSSQHSHAGAIGLNVKF